MNGEKFSLPKLCLDVLQRDGGSWSVAEVTDHLETHFENVCDDHYVTKDSVMKALNALCRWPSHPIVREASGDGESPIPGVIPTRWRYRVRDGADLVGEDASQEPREAGNSGAGAPATVATPSGTAQTVSVAFSPPVVSRLEALRRGGLHGETLADVVDRIVCGYLAQA